jgi:hypothetical protein
MGQRRGQFAHRRRARHMHQLQVVSLHRELGALPTRQPRAASGRGLDHSNTEPQRGRRADVEHVR